MPTIIYSPISEHITCYRPVYFRLLTTDPAAIGIQAVLVIDGSTAIYSENTVPNLSGTPAYYEFDFQNYLQDYTAMGAPPPLSVTTPLGTPISTPQRTAQFSVVFYEIVVVGGLRQISPLVAVSGIYYASNQIYTHSEAAGLADFPAFTDMLLTDKTEDTLCPASKDYLSVLSPTGTAINFLFTDAANNVLGSSGFPVIASNETQTFEISLANLAPPAGTAFVLAFINVQQYIAYTVTADCCQKSRLYWKNRYGSLDSFAFDIKELEDDVSSTRYRSPLQPLSLYTDTMRGIGRRQIEVSAEYTLQADVYGAVLRNFIRYSFRAADTYLVDYEQSPTVYIPCIVEDGKFAIRGESPYEYYQTTIKVTENTHITHRH